MSVAEKIIRNTAFNIFGRFASLLVTLFLTPFIIRYLGLEVFSLWVVIGTLTGYFGLFDLGIANAFIKYICEHFTRRQMDTVSEIVSTGTFFYALFALVTVAVSFAAIDFILTIFKIPLYLRLEARWVFLVSICLFALGNIVSVFEAVPAALQRFDILSKITIVLSVVTAAGTIYFLKAGFGLRGLVFNNAVVLGVRTGLNLAVAYRLLPGLKLSPFLFSRQMFLKLFKFGYKLQVARWSSMLSIHFDKLLICYFLSMGLVTYYQLGSNIVLTAVSLSLLLIPALLPAFAEIQAKGEREKLAEGYLRGTRYISLVAIPLFIFIIITADRIVAFWMGKGFELSVVIIRVLAPGWLLAVLCGVGGAVLQAEGKPEIEMRTSLLVAVLNVPISILLIYRFGFMGVALGTTLSFFFAAVYFYIRLHRELQIPADHFFKTALAKILAVCLVVGIPVWLTSVLVINIFHPEGRVWNLSILLFQAGMFFGLYLKLLPQAGLFDDAVITLLWEKLPFLKICDCRAR
ncbi:MAG: polysaccharide biosynthesis C-terminal domain-containing protein [Candidatus Omnitrophota bacterium]